MIWMNSETKLEPNDWRRKDCHYVPIFCDMDLTPEFLIRINHCNCQAGCTTNRCSLVKYELPCTEACGLCRRDGSCTTCEKPTLDAGEEQSANQNSEFCVEAWLSMQILHFSTLIFPIEWKNECYRSCLGWYELLSMLFIFVLTYFFPQIKPLFCFKISFGGHFVSGPISPSPPTKDFPRFFEGCYDVFLLKIQVWFLSPFFVPWPITYIKDCMLSGILFFLII